MPAATSAPNAITRMASVIGSEKRPAFSRSSAKAVLIPSTTLASPNSPMKSSGCACCASSTRGEHGLDLVDGLVLVAADLELDERGVPVLRDLALTAGIERRAEVLHRRHLRDARRRRPRSRPRRRDRSCAASSLWIRTLSPAGCLKPASRILSARPDSPGPAVLGSMVLVPTAPPIAKAAMTRPSQPKVAVFQWLALQRPIRAARLRLVCVRDTAFSP